jgi:elongation factor 1-beta
MIFSSYVSDTCSIFDVKPLGDDTDLNEMEKVVRAITLDGLTWGPSKFVDIAYGVKKLQISCVVVDDKVPLSRLSFQDLNKDRSVGGRADRVPCFRAQVYTEDIEEQIMAHEELVQSVDIASFTKV